MPTIDPAPPADPANVILRVRVDSDRPVSRLEWLGDDGPGSVDLPVDVALDLIGRLDSGGRDRIASLEAEVSRLIASEGNIARERAQAEAEEERLGGEVAALTARLASLTAPKPDASEAEWKAEIVRLTTDLDALRAERDKGYASARAAERKLADLTRRREKANACEAPGMCVHGLSLRDDCAQCESFNEGVAFGRKDSADRIAELTALRCDCDEESGQHNETCPVTMHEQLDGAHKEVESLRAEIAKRDHANEGNLKATIADLRERNEWQANFLNQIGGHIGYPQGNDASLWHAVERVVRERDEARAKASDATDNPLTGRNAWMACAKKVEKELDEARADLLTCHKRAVAAEQEERKRIAEDAVAAFIDGHARRLCEQHDGCTDARSMDFTAAEIHGLLNSLRTNRDGDIIDGRATAKAAPVAEADECPGCAGRLAGMVDAICSTCRAATIDALAAEAPSIDPAALARAYLDTADMPRGPDETGEEVVARRLCRALATVGARPVKVLTRSDVTCAVLSFPRALTAPDALDKHVWSKLTASGPVALPALDVEALRQAIDEHDKYAKGRRNADDVERDAFRTLAKIRPVLDAILAANGTVTP